MGEVEDAHSSPALSLPVPRGSLVLFYISDLDAAAQAGDA